MKTAAFSILGLMFVAFLLIPSVQAIEWSVNINPTDPTENLIFPGTTAVISATGPTDGEIYVEIIDANTTNTVIRFPESGSIPLIDGVAIITWDVPETFPIALYHLSLTDDSIGSVRALRSFKVWEPDSTVTGEDDPTIVEMLQDLIRLESWRNGFERS